MIKLFFAGSSKEPSEPTSLPSTNCEPQSKRIKRSYNVSWLHAWSSYWFKVQLISYAIGTISNWTGFTDSQHRSKQNDVGSSNAGKLYLKCLLSERLPPHLERFEC